MLLAEQPAEEDRQLHRALLSTAIASGESLLLEDAEADGLRLLRLSVKALRAKLESLRITFEQWHADMQPERQAAVLREVFGAEVRTT